MMQYLAASPHPGFRAPLADLQRDVLLPADMPAVLVQEVGGRIRWSSESKGFGMACLPGTLAGCGSHQLCLVCGRLLCAWHGWARAAQVVCP